MVGESGHTPELFLMFRIVHVIVHILLCCCTCEIIGIYENLVVVVVVVVANSSYKELNYFLK